MCIAIWRRLLLNPSSDLASCAVLGPLCRPCTVARRRGYLCSLLLLVAERSAARRSASHGAQCIRSSVLVLVMREGLLLTGIGVVVGLAGASRLSRLIASLEVVRGDAQPMCPTVAGVTATTTIVAAVACVLPAWRASRLDPNAALRV